MVSFGSWLCKLQTKIACLSCFLGKHVAGKFLMAEDWKQWENRRRLRSYNYSKAQVLTTIHLSHCKLSVGQCEGLCTIKHHCKQGETADPFMGGASLEHSCSVQPKQEQMTWQKVTEVLWETGTQQKFMVPEALNIINWQRGSEEMAPWVSKSVCLNS